MARTDLIGDAFTIIRNAIMSRKENVDAPASNTVKAILEILKREGYIETFKLIEDKKQGLFVFISNMSPENRRYEILNVFQGRGCVCMLSAIRSRMYCAGEVLR